MIARHGLLFVAGVVFFVDDDEAELLDGGEDGGAGADDDARLTFANTVPLFAAFFRGEAGVERATSEPKA